MSGTFLQGGQVHANGIRQHYLRYGGVGPKLILVPGITSPAITWGFVAERLGVACDTYVLDVRGRGLSDGGPDLNYGLDACADDLLAFAATLVGPCLVLGHSMGARIALRAGARAPGAFTGLALVDPPVSGPGRRPYPSNLAWYIDSMAQSRRGMSADDMRRFCPTWSDEQLALRAEWLPTCSEVAVRATYDSFHTDDIHQDLPDVKAPVLLMVATRGDVIRTEDVAEIRTLLPDISVNHVPDAGHMIPWDNLKGFFDALEGFAGLSFKLRRRAA